METSEQQREDRCGRCKWGTYFGTDIGCGYMLRTGEPRGCKSWECTRYEEGRPSDNPFDRFAIVRASR